MHEENDLTYTVVSREHSQKANNMADKEMHNQIDAE